MKIQMMKILVGEEDIPPIHPDGDDKTAGDMVNEALDNIGD